MYLRLPTGVRVLFVRVLQALAAKRHIARPQAHMREQNAPTFIERITCALQALRTDHRGIKIGPTFPVQRSSGRWRIQQTIQWRLLLVFT